MQTDPARLQALRFELRLALTLQAEGLLPTWQAELLGEGPGDRIRFESLPALNRYLSSLDANVRLSHGIR